MEPEFLGMQAGTYISILTLAMTVACAACDGGGSALPAVRADVTFSHERGLYDTPFDLALSTDLQNATLRYTTDGSAPTRRRGIIYASPVRIDTTTVVRALAFDEKSTGESVTTHTYLFPAHVPRQPKYPRGYVTTYVSERQQGPQQFDYGLDPRIVDDRQSNGDIVSHLEELPSLCLSLAIDDFNSLYANHRRRGVQWERPASVELVYSDRASFSGFEGFQANCGIRMQGALAVDQARKKSFRLFFKKRYGAGKLDYPLFESAVHHAHSAVGRFDTVVLRAGGNTNWSKDDAYKHGPSTYLRDQFVRDTEIAMRGLGARGIFVHLYVNGLYFGMYNVTERPDAKFLAAYLGGEGEDYCSVNHNGTVGGDAARWNELLRLATAGSLNEPARYRVAEEYLDIEGFCDYVLLNWSVGTGDWPYNNWYAGARTRPPGQFSFICWDAELAFWPQPYHNSNPGGWVSPMFRGGAGPIPALWRALEINPDFLATFGDRVYRHSFGGGALSDEKMRGRFVRLADSIENAIVAESARWGDAAAGNESDPRTRAKDWYPNRDAVLALMHGNVNRFIGALRAAGYYPTIDPPAIDELLVPVRAGVMLSLRNPNGRGVIHYTTDGTDPGRSDPSPGGVSARSRVFDGTRMLILEDTTRVRARVRNGTEWSALADELILMGRERLPLRITELMYHPPESEACEFIEIRNISSAPVELTGVRLGGVGYHFSPGSVLAANGVLVLIPDDDPEAFRKKYPQTPISGTYRGHLSNGGEEIRLVDAEGNTISAVVYDDEGDWPQEADGLGHSIELRDLEDPPGGLRDWRASGVAGGTPGS